MQQLLPVHRFARDPAAYCIKTCAWFSSTVPLQLTVNVRYNFTFHSPHCKRHTSHCTLPTSPLFTFHTSPINIHTSHCQRHITYGTLHTSHCTLQHSTRQHITLPVSHFTLHILHCTLPNSPLTLHPSHFTFQGCLSSFKHVSLHRLQPTALQQQCTHTSKAPLTNMVLSLCHPWTPTTHNAGASIVKTNCSLLMCKWHHLSSIASLILSTCGKLCLQCPSTWT